MLQNAVQSMALLTFGFMDYETFANSGLGLGDWKPTIIVIFWITVMILIVISQNIVLSIVVNAYQDVSTNLSSNAFLLPVASPAYKGA